MATAYKSDLKASTVALHHCAVWAMIYAVFLLLWSNQNEPNFNDWIKVSSVFASMLPLVYAVYWAMDRGFELWARLALSAVIVVVHSVLVLETPGLVSAEQPFMQQLINGAFTAAFALSLRSAGRSVRLGRARALAEQRALSAQLAPHTLYNLLNIIYSATLSDADKAGRLVLRLSDMMRHLTVSAEKDFVLASQEWAFIQDYAAFARERTPTDADINLMIEGDQDRPLPSMLCATLFENAVKHALAAEHMSIAASLRLTTKGFHFSVENSIGSSPQAVTGLGVGQAAVQSRLKHLYGRRFRYEVSEQAARYRVEIEAW